MDGRKKPQAKGKGSVGLWKNQGASWNNQPQKRHTDQGEHTLESLVEAPPGLLSRDKSGIRRMNYWPNLQRQPVSSGSIGTFYFKL